MNINRDILRLALPSILANITIPLVGLVDTAIVGHISDAASIGGIAIGTMLFDLLYWNFGFLRVGTSGLTAQSFGAQRLDECTRILRRSVSIALLAAILIWAIQWLFVTAVLAVVPCSVSAANVARRYFFIRIWAAPSTLCLMAFKGWFIGMQDTRSPMAVDIVVNAINMLASYLLAVPAGLGVEGVAWGTLIAQYTGLVLACSILVSRYRFVFRRMEWWSGDWGRIIRLNTNLFIRSLCFMVVYVGFTSLAGRYGDNLLAVSSILMKLFMFFSYFVDGFAYAGEALVGRFIGEKSLDSASLASRFSPLISRLFVWSLGVGILFTLIYAIWGQPVIGLLTDDAAVLTSVPPYLGWLIAMPIISTLAFMWDGLYVGATEGVAIRNSMIWAAISFVVAYLITYRWCGLHALYVAYFAHLIARVAYLTAQYPQLKQSILTTDD